MTFYQQTSISEEKQEVDKCNTMLLYLIQVEHAQIRYVSEVTVFIFK